MTKGQFIRLFLSADNTNTPTAVIASAKSLSLHVSVSVENSTTKDTDGGDWVSNEPTAINYDISSSALVRGNDTITSSVGSKGLADLQQIWEGSAPVKWQIAIVSGANQRTKGSVLFSGSAVIANLNINAQNRQVATYDCSMNGYGDINVGS